MDKSRVNYGLAILLFVGIFAIWMIALLCPEDISTEGGLVIGASISIATLVAQYFFRKAPK